MPSAMAATATRSCGPLITSGGDSFSTLPNLPPWLTMMPLAWS